MIGTTVSHYRILSHIGAGGMGTVYLAEDLNLRRRVALKFLAPATGSNPEGAARLLREARAASALDHPHISTIYEVGESGGQPFIAMAYYEGETLAARLARGPLPIADAARILSQTADALAAAHAAGIVHRDLKPSNLMVTSSGQVKVLDFGIAKVEMGETSTQLTREGSTVGTAAYMSPEQAEGEAADARADVWSLGVVAYEVLTGRTPFEGTSALAVIHAVLTATPQPIRVRRPDVPGELADVVERTLVRDRERRTITALEVYQLASTCLARLVSGAQPIVARAGRSPVRIGATIIALVIVAAAGGWWLRRSANMQWAREQALPEIGRLADSDQFAAAYDLAQRAREYIPNDPLLSEQLQMVTNRASIGSDPAGAHVSYRPYARSDAAWRQLGRTPLKDVSVPKGAMQWRVELAGHDRAEDVGPGPFWIDRQRARPIVDMQLRELPEHLLLNPRATQDRQHDRVPQYAQHRIRREQQGRGAIGFAQDLGRVRQPLLVVRIKKRSRCAVADAGQLPRKIRCVLHSGRNALPPGWAMNVRRVAREEDSPVAHPIDHAAVDSERREP